MKIKFKKALSLLIVFTLALSSLYIPTGALAEETTPASGPYANHSIPGFIALPEFDYGGIDKAFSKPFTKQSNYVFREDAMELNFYDSPYGTTMAFMGSEWLNFTVDVKKTATYEVNLHYATTVEKSTIQFFLDGDKNLHGECIFGPTGDWSEIKSVYGGLIDLPEGKHTIKISCYNGSMTARGISFKEHEEKVSTDYKKTIGAYRYTEIPTIIEAENFDMGNGNYLSQDGINNGESGRLDAGIDVINNERNHKIILLDGDYTQYTFNVSQSGPYKFSLSGRGDGELYFDDIENPVPFKVGEDGFADIITVWLDAGEHKIKLKADYLSCDYIKAETGTGDYLTYKEIATYEPPKPVEIDKNAVDKEFYVAPDGDDANSGTKDSPFKTMERARQEVDKFNDNMTGNIIVHFAPGYYQLTETQHFTETDSGTNGYSVIYKGDGTKENPSLISGGTKITGWEPTGDGYIWKAKADVEDTRTLYINGLPAQRAAGKYKIRVLENWLIETDEHKAGKWSDGIKVSADNLFIDFAHPEDLELVWTQWWCHQRNPVEDVFVDPTDSSKVVFKMDQPYWMWANKKEFPETNPINMQTADAQPHVKSSFHIENARELLDQPGEFFFDKYTKEIFYYPYMQEDLTTAETYVGTTQFLIDVTGAGKLNKVRNLTFDNLDFRYGAYLDANTLGVQGTQTDHLVGKLNNPIGNGGFPMPGQFKVNFGDNVNILNCTFRCLGSSAIVMDNGVINSTVQGNLISDVSGTGIMIDSYEHVNIDRPGRERCDNILVANNVIRRPANEFKGMTGISMYLPSRTTITHNEIYETPYSGMVIGWGWGSIKALDARNNKITHNYIYDVTDNVRDGGHIYSLDYIDVEMAYNYLDLSGDYRGGIYLDSGSSLMDMHHNVLSNNTNWLFARTDVGLRWDKAYENYWAADQVETVDRKNVDYHDNHKVELDADGNPMWPDEALEIIDNAGLEDEYKHLLDGTELPAWRTDVLDTEPLTYYGDQDALWVEAENYIKGAGQDSGYHTLNGLEPKEFVDNRGTVIGQTGDGYWLMYDVTIGKTMDYDVIINASNAQPDPQPHVSVYIDGKKMIDTALIENSGHWDNYRNYNVGTIPIEAGSHAVKIEMNKNGFSFDKFKFHNDHYFDGDVYDETKIVKQKTTFMDIVDHWAEKDIYTLVKAGVINGVSDTAYAPEDTLSLYQAVWLVSRCLNIKYEDDCCWKEKAASYGFMNANDADRPISREEFAHIVMQGFKYRVDGSTLVMADLDFNDASAISDIYKVSVAQAVQLRFILGDENHNFNPKSNLTRAEAAAIIARFKAKL